MTSISSIDTVKPPRSPSPATSPTLEDDITQNGAWLARDGAETDHGKGKARQRYVDLGEDNAELSDTNSYPPTNEQEAETRRIEETLRSWEIAERQRRKAARGSTSSSIPTSPSLLSDVTRRASQLWRSGSRRRNPSIGGKHTALRSTDNLDTVPLEDINASPTPTPSPSPTPSTFTPSLRRQSIDADPVADAIKKTVVIGDDSAAENPFENPTPPNALVPVSPFADTYRVNPDSDHLQTPVKKSQSRVTENRRSRLPPPLPLDLPRPKTPPVAISTPPYPIDPPAAVHSAMGENNGGKPVRWWHEWLCGCGEGPDRGGDYQAGRTNPLE
ncbi:hypothetical protein P691DRAFT_795057 [Macrolepiota fuliginosa MF-IS2]|uniref:Uncharacterized protein n=1 Tax=Macrolepiota fuliginosa MF-IS2 TaxID=1400762 RepID=A0A9P5XKZ0_9AGAR|nr:hypothetical protein P691DRAFT_795057 [Macrolepiota fuliginosa MF-IS2]